jgi:predicted Na+-dependent transporter
MNMNLKRIFGALLTVLGICGLIYAAVLFVSTPTNDHNVKVLITYGVLGTVFFVSGLGLVRTTKDES